MLTKAEAITGAVLAVAIAVLLVLIIPRVHDHYRECKAHGGTYVRTALGGFECVKEVRP